MIDMILFAIIILSIYAWINWTPEQEAIYQQARATEAEREKQARHERWEIGARRWRMELAACQANVTEVNQPTPSAVNKPKKVVKSIPASSKKPASPAGTDDRNSVSDQQFYDKFGIWPDEMGEHPYNPPTR